MMKPLHFRIPIEQPTSKTACELLAYHTGLSKSRIKQAMIRGAVWLGHLTDHPKRLRRATAKVGTGDILELYYDPSIIDTDPPLAGCLCDHHHYSIWFKPAGLMTQGTRYGDHCSLSRQVESHVQARRPVNIVHRLDREVSGLLVVAHGRQAAARFSAMLRQGALHKRYRVRVLGNLNQSHTGGRIERDLDGKPARTAYSLIDFDTETNQSIAMVEIDTGRLHQIRRHFAAIGFPVIGDPRYGHGNKNRSGLQLSACALTFECPFGRGRIHVEIDPDNPGFVIPDAEIGPIQHDSGQSDA